MIVKIHEPYWGAAKRYGWPKGIWGIGLDSEKIKKAIENKEKVDITIHKFKDRFRISPVTIKNYAEKNGTTYRARFKTLLYVIPSTLLGKYKVK